MKKQNIFGAIALSAALAMGTAMPAFAVSSGISDDPDLSSGDSVNTTVKAYSLTDEELADSVSATVPLYLYVVTPEKGGELTCPTNYYMKNTGSNDLKVSKIKSSAFTGWEIVADDAGLANATWASDVTYRIMMNMTAAGQEITLKSAEAGNTSTNLVLKAGEDEASNTLKFALEGKTAVKNAASGTTIPDDIEMVKVTYTVAKNA